MRIKRIINSKVKIALTRYGKAIVKSTISPHAFGKIHQEHKPLVSSQGSHTSKESSTSAYSRHEMIYSRRSISKVASSSPITTQNSSLIKYRNLIKEPWTSLRDNLDRVSDQRLPPPWTILKLRCSIPSQFKVELSRPAPYFPSQIRKKETQPRWTTCTILTIPTNSSRTFNWRMRERNEWKKWRTGKRTEPRIETASEWCKDSSAKVSASTRLTVSILLTLFSDDWT